jgi:hypothetical protein
MPRVFLSYRREDASGHAGRLYDLLAARYGATHVFMDIDAIPLGSEFRETINRAVASCDVLIALIGRDWLDARDADGRRRLDDPDDFVRREIEAALAAGVVVVPASVQGAEFPRPGALPESLVPLTRRQGFQLSDAGWQDDVQRLIRRLEAVPAQQQAGARPVERPPSVSPRRPGRRALAAAGLGGLAVVAAVAALVLLQGDDDGGEESSSGAAGSSAPAPEVSPAKGAVTLGSDLRTAPGSDRWYCTGSGPESDPCSFVLTRLPEPDQLLRAPFDGVVTRWRVHEGGGPMRLIVVRGEFTPGGRSTLAWVSGSGEEQVSGDTGQPFRTRMKIRRGDAVGLQFSVGAYGNAPYSEGTWLEEWVPPLAAEPKRATDIDTTTYQLLYNASVERDRDGDGYGDATQDDCPKDRDRHTGC